MKAPKVILYQDKAREWRWQYVSPNGRCMADSGEGYKRRATCLRAAVTLFGAEATLPTFHLRTPSGLLTRV